MPTCRHNRTYCVNHILEHTAEGVAHYFNAAPSFFVYVHVLNYKYPLEIDCEVIVQNYDMFTILICRQLKILIYVIASSPQPIPLRA